MCIRDRPITECSHKLHLPIFAIDPHILSPAVRNQEANSGKEGVQPGSEHIHQTAEPNTINLATS